jgi:UDP-N-acetyl-D-glucosamine dehydrogenase
MKEYKYFSRFIELAGDINANMPRHVVNNLTDFLNSKDMHLKGLRILVLGVAYKNDIGDMRESPALELIELLLEKGAMVDFTDPYVPEMMWHDGIKKSVGSDPETIASYDLLITATKHGNFDIESIYKSARLIYDTRNVFADIKDPEKENKLKLLGT